MSDEHIATVTRLFGDFAEAELASTFDASGKETGREVIAAAEFAPEPPAGGKVESRPHRAHLQEPGLRLHHDHVERPLRDEAGKVLLGQKGKAKGSRSRTPRCATPRTCPWRRHPDVLRTRSAAACQDAWIDGAKSKVGYEIPFNRHFTCSSRRAICTPSTRS
jgi:hypothetical protein